MTNNGNYNTTMATLTLKADDFRIPKEFEGSVIRSSLKDINNVMERVYDGALEPIKVVICGKNIYLLLLSRSNEIVSTRINLFIDDETKDELIGFGRPVVSHYSSYVILFDAVYKSTCITCRIEKRKEGHEYPYTDTVIEQMTVLEEDEVLAGDMPKLISKASDMFFYGDLNINMRAFKSKIESIHYSPYSNRGTPYITVILKDNTKVRVVLKDTVMFTFPADPAEIITEDLICSKSNMELKPIPFSDARFQQA